MTNAKPTPELPKAAKPTTRTATRNVPIRTALKAGSDPSATDGGWQLRHSFGDPAEG